MGSRRPTRGDLVVAGVLTAFGLVTVLVATPARGSGITRDADLLGVVLGLLATAPLALRRAAPFPVLAVTTAAIVVAGARGSAIAAAGLGPVLAATSAAYVTDRRGAIVAAILLGVGGSLATGLAFDGEPGATVQVFTTLVIAVLATLVGDVLRTLHQRNRELEELRAVEAREAVAQDRVRIAREVHDVVGHALAGIALQARVGRRLVERDPARTADALRQIDELATDALGETREAVGWIRGPEEAAELRPQPGLADLDELVARLHEDDLRVTLERRGDASGVPATVQASAYRIVQEALSNVMRHARPASAVVRVAADDGALEVEVLDDGRRAPADDGRGHGLRGMRERAAQCGGSLEAGPRPDGGWRVRARLPLVRGTA